MTQTMNTNDFVNITNTWKQIFAEFIEFVIDENDNIYEQNIFKSLRKTNASPTTWTKFFLENLEANLIYEYNGSEYSEFFMSIVYANFNDLEIMMSQMETIKQYLKFLCIESRLGENYYRDIDENTDIMDNDDKKQFCKVSLICTSIQFAGLHKNFIEDIITNNLTPNIHLK